MTRPIASAFLALIPLLAAGSPASAAQEPAESAAPQVAAAVTPPASAEEAFQVDPDDLRAQLEQLTVEDLETHLQAWMALLDAAQAEWAQALLSPPDPDVSLPQLAVRRDGVANGLDVVAQVVSESGGDARSAYAAIAADQAQELKRSDKAFTVPAGAGAARALPLEVLRSCLRPLTKDQVGIQLEGWLQLLRGKCLAVRNIEVAALQSSSPEEIASFNARAVRLRAEREHLIERVNVVIDSLEEKAGDVVEARAFVDSVVQTPPITRWRAALSTATAWLLSSDGGLSLGMNALKAIATLVIAWYLSGLLGRLAKRGMKKFKSVSDLLRSFVVVSVRRVALIIGLLVALSMIGVDMTPMLAAIGAAGLVVGLALQGTLSNFASGLLIMINRPFDMGDLVSIAGLLGHVRGMTLLSTCIETLDSQTIYIPNNKVWGDTITNLTANPRRRVDMMFGIAYEDDFKRAQSILLEIVRAHPKVLEDPEPVVRVHELGDSSVNFAVRPWTMNDDYWDVYWDITEAVKDRFDSEGVSIPFPQRDVHVIQAPDANGATGAPGSAGEHELQPAPRSTGETVQPT